MIDQYMVMLLGNAVSTKGFCYLYFDEIAGRKTSLLDSNKWERKLEFMFIEVTLVIATVLQYN